MTRPNIVLVTVDSLRADHCGFHGYDREITPTLDRLADEGLILENAIAPGPATPESMSVIHTGQFLKPYYTGNADVPIIHRRENVRSHLSNHPTIAEALSRAGYTTLGFSPNPFTSRPFGFQKGFDEYEDFLDSTSRGPTSSIYRRMFERFIGGDTQLTPIRLLLNWIQREEMFKSWDQYYDQVVDTVNRVEEPFFLWVFLLDTHLPYLVGATDSGGLSWLDMWRYNDRLY
jgi:arylsulfatase